jgi:hypothetical protein
MPPQGVGGERSRARPTSRDATGRSDEFRLEPRWQVSERLPGKQVIKVGPLGAGG